MDLPLSHFEKNGCAFFADAFPKDDCDKIIIGLDGANVGAGLRGNKLPSAILCLIQGSDRLRNIAVSLIGSEAKPVRVILFDKTGKANWGVPWHQDKTIAVQKKADICGYGPWTRKSDIPHVEAPESVLSSMVTLRVHLDDCGSNDGPLIVLKGGHRKGKQSQADIVAMAGDLESVPIVASKGDVFAMSPMLPHHSRSAKLPLNRRVLHIEYAACDLPFPLEWYGIG